MTTVVLAPPSQRPVLEVLCDMSAAGLLQPFAWLEGGTDVVEFPAVLWVADGRITVRRLRDVTDAIEGRARLLSLVPAGRDALRAEDEMAYRQRFRPRLSVQITYARCVVVTDGTTPDHPVQPITGWHNLVLSPEVTDAPDVRPNPWWTEPDKIPGAVASALVVLGGLWHSRPESVLDSRAPDHDGFRVVRWFLRGVNPEKVEGDVRRGLFEFTGALQGVSTDSGADVRPVPDPARAAADMASRWWAAVRGDVVSDIPNVPVPPAKDLSARETLVWFFRFLWASLRGLPRSWSERVVHQAKAQVAGVVEHSVFGDDESVYRVVVDGVDAQGRPAQWAHVRESAKVVAARSRSHDEPQTPRPRLGNVWRAFVDGALTLLDARARLLPPVRTTEGVGIVDHTDRIAPPPELRQFSIGARSLRATDILGAADLDRELTGRAADGDPHSAQLLQRLREWGTAVRESYVVQASHRVAQEIESRRQRMRELTSQLDTITEDDVHQDFKDTGTRLRLLLLLPATAIIVSAVLARLEIIEWSTVAWVAVGAVILWLGVALAIFISRQRRLFQLLTAVQTRRDMEPHIRAAIHACAEQLATLSDAYLSLQAWSAVVGEFVHRPFGRVEIGDGEHRLPEGMPAAIQVTEAHANPKLLVREVNDLRRDYYKVGWAGTPWQQTLANIAQALDDDAAGRRFEQTPDRIFDEPGDPGLTLDRWAQAVEQVGVSQEGTAELVTRSQQMLDSGTVQLTAGNVSAREFLSPLERDEPGEIVEAVLTTNAVAQNRRMTEEQLMIGATDDLSQPRVLVALTPVLLAGDLKVASTPTGVLHGMDLSGPGPDESDF